jgi:hypothetical protein
MSVIDDVRDRLDIVDVVGSYVELKKAGRSFKACRPFHAEKTPSFIVNPDRGTWHCFSACGTVAIRSRNWRCPVWPRHGRMRRKHRRSGPGPNTAAGQNAVVEPVLAGGRRRVTGVPWIGSN